MADLAQKAGIPLPRLYVIPAEGGEARQLTDRKEGVEEIAWSPDSTRIAFMSRARDGAYDEEDDKKRAPRRFTRVRNGLWPGPPFAMYATMIPIDSHQAPRELS